MLLTAIRKISCFYGLSSNTPSYVTGLSFTIDNGTVITGFTPSMTVAAAQALINTALGVLPAPSSPSVPNTLLTPLKWQQAVTLYGTTLSCPIDIEFTGMGYQYLSHTIGFGVYNDSTLLLITNVQKGSYPINDTQVVTIGGNPRSGSFTLTNPAGTSGTVVTITYNESYTSVAAALVSNSWAPLPAVTGSLPTGLVFYWPAADGPFPVMVTDPSGLNNSAVILNEPSGAGAGAAGVQAGGAGASLAVIDITQGVGPNYWDCPANFSPASVPGSGDTLIIDDASEALLYGLCQQSTFTVATTGVNATLRYTRNRQVFQNGQKVYLTVTGTAPSGLTSGNAYYIVGQANNYTFQLSATYGGSPVTITTVGSGTFSLAVKGLILQVYNRYSGNEIGLPNTNTTTSLPEYLPKYLRLSGVNAQIGLGVDGDGIGLLRLDAYNDAATITIDQSGSAVTTDVPAILLLANNAASTLEVETGDVGMSFYSNEATLIGTITVHGGNLILNNVIATTLYGAPGVPITETNCAIGQTLQLG